MSASARRRLLIIRTDKLRGDVLPGEFVQYLWGGPVGILKSVEKNGIGLVHWLKRPGVYDIVDTQLLKQTTERGL